MPNVNVFRLKKKTTEQPSYTFFHFTLSYIEDEANITSDLVLKYFSRMNHLPQVPVGLLQVHRMAVPFEIVIPLHSLFHVIFDNVCIM